MTGLPSISVIAHDLGAPEIKDDRCAAWFRGGKNPRSLKLDDEKGAWFDFGQQQGGGIVRLVDIALGVDRREAAAWLQRKYGLKPDPAMRSRSSYRPRAVLQKTEENDQRNVERALSLWAETEPLPGTIGADYYARRGLSADRLEHAVRFHPRSPFGGERHSCVVALLRDVETDEPRGIHRTAITGDGRKIDRKMLGRSGNGAVKLTPDADVTMGLGIAEGVETALSVVQSGWTPVWAALSAGSIKQFPVLPGIEHLTIWADHDEAGLNAARACAERWSTSGASATIRYPEATKADFNDRGQQ
jgi:phage/plasmid primase-like uncharacterized protein